MKDFIFIDRYSRNDLESLFKLTDEIIKNPGEFSSECRGMILGSLFYEPSTRTRLSFQSAMMRLGGLVLGFDSAEVSSVKKGETTADTARMVSNYADIIVVRHSFAGAPQVMAEYSDVPVINGGDDSNQHPTQTLMDLYTISRCMGKIEGLKVGIYGDLRYGRAPHSLAYGAALFGAKIVNIAPRWVAMPDYVMQRLRKLYQADVETVETLDGAIADLDVLYINRLQKERLPQDVDGAALEKLYSTDKRSLINAKKDMIILHPLPRVNELAYELDTDPRAKYFEQARNGLYVRMALILALLGKSSFELSPIARNRFAAGDKCPNEKCITNVETYVDPVAESLVDGDDETFCVYCGYPLSRGDK